MTKIFLPDYPENDLFTTAFSTHANKPGFFPGTGGFFHGHPTTAARFAFFGTDFGPIDYQKTLGDSGEREDQRTICALRSITTEAGIDLNDCHLTNAVLCLRKGTSATSKFPIWKIYSDYVEMCATWHRDRLKERKTRAVVLMGLPHLHSFGALLFPELAIEWQGLKTLKSVYCAGKEKIVLHSGINVLLMHHPSFWHAYPSCFKVRAVSHLRSLINA